MPIFHRLGEAKKNIQVEVDKLYRSLCQSSYSIHHEIMLFACFCLFESRLSPHMKLFMNLKVTPPTFFGGSSTKHQAPMIPKERIPEMSMEISIFPNLSHDPHGHFVWFWLNTQVGFVRVMRVARALRGIRVMRLLRFVHALRRWGCDGWIWGGWEDKVSRFGWRNCDIIDLLFVTFVMF